jgi:putative ABC transport system permease protein
MIMLSNLHYSVRMLLKNPSFAIVAIITLAVGIGANAAIFSFVNGLLFRPVSGVERPDRLVAVFTSDYSSGTYGASSYPDYLDFQKQSEVFEDLAAYEGDSFTLSGVENAAEVRTALVTSNYFQVLGVSAQLGRTLRSDDQEESIVVLSPAFWKRHFGGDTSVVGRSITLNDKPYTIIGVAAESFHGLRFGWQPEIWMSMSAKIKEGGRGNRGFGITGRLRDGVSVQQAQAELSTIAGRLAREYPETNRGTLAQPNAPRSVSVVPEARVITEGNNGIRVVTMLLFVVVAIVLLIACANVANLFLARASARRREFAIRLALGASRWQLIRQLLTESTLLALLGGVAGLLVAFWTAGLIPALFSSGEMTDLDVSADWRVLLFTGAVSILTGILFGITPAIQASRPQLISTLKDDQIAPILGRRRLGFRGLLVTAQVALSVLLLVAAGLFLRSLRNAVTFNPGFENRNLLIASLTVGRNLTKPQLANFFQDLTDNLSAEPGVRSVSLTRVEPLSGGGERRNVVIEGYQPRPNEDTELNTNVVGLNFFNTIGIPIVAGRDFGAGDREGAAGVVVVNEEFAQRYFPGSSPLGKHVRVDSEGQFLEIVGLVRTAKHRDLRELPLPIIYLPLAQEMQGDMTLVVRTMGEPSSLRGNIRDVVQRINRNVPVASVKTISEQINEVLAPDRTMALLLAIFGAAALLLATVGIYGVVAYAVSQRTHEIGIRMALGARSADVWRLMVRDGMTMAVIGLAIGLTGAFAITRVISSLLFGVKPTDLITFLIVTLGLLFVAFVASYLPARRATKVDPLAALRCE